MPPLTVLSGPHVFSRRHHDIDALNSGAEALDDFVRSEAGCMRRSEQGWVEFVYVKENERDSRGRLAVAAYMAAACYHGRIVGHELLVDKSCQRMHLGASLMFHALETQQRRTDVPLHNAWGVPFSDAAQQFMKEAGFREEPTAGMRLAALARDDLRTPRLRPGFKLIAAPGA